MDNYFEKESKQSRFVDVIRALIYALALRAGLSEAFKTVSAEFHGFAEPVQ